MTNPNNYVGATISLTGYAASSARFPAYDKEGTRGILQVPVALNEGYKPKDGEFVKTGTTWYDIEAGGDAAQVLQGISKGDKIRVDDAKQEVRSYKAADGTDKLGITLKFGTVTILEQATSSSDTPF